MNGLNPGLYYGDDKKGRKREKGEEERRMK